MKGMHRRFFSATFLLGLFLSIPSAAARDHYSYELSERLKPLIEWRDYGEPAFNEAIEKNKPIFLLLTAPSWCHWCQVYESEEYLFDTRIYPFINKNFIPIYVDADRRQDLTRHYLEGGWPSTTIMTPSRERLWGFSGVRPIQTMLSNFNQATAFVDAVGFASPVTVSYQKTNPRIPTNLDLQVSQDRYLERAESLFDSTHGGFGSRMKFPQPRTLMVLLDQGKLEPILTTLENQYTKIEEIKTNYNLFDPVEGGWHRYGTQRNWTPPHYEKMLYDNAKLFQLYARLESSELAQQVTQKTWEFLKSWYDPKVGGFASNSDAFTEHRYFARTDRPNGELRVEQTRYTDWNADAIIALFDVGTRRKDKEMLKIAGDTLEFFLEEMVDEAGPYHYMAPDGERGVQGNLLDSASLLVASVEGIRKTQNSTYLSGAKQIADFSLDNLYDWYAGGFFERNSSDSSLYAADERLLLEKPIAENGKMIYGLLLLFEATQDLRYLNAAVKTMGQMVWEVGYLDSGYFLYQAAGIMLEKNILETYQERSDEIAQIDEKGQSTFFLQANEATSYPPKARLAKGGKLNQANEAKTFVPIDPSPLDGSPFLFLLLIALLAGLLSFLSPCTLPILPAYVATAIRTGREHQIRSSVSFVVGLTIVFALMGMSATFIGGFLRENLVIFTQVIGIVIMVFGGMMIFGKGFGGVILPAGRSLGGGWSPLFLGATLGLSWTPCVGPILVAILAMASTLDSSLAGGALLTVYGLGLGLPLVLLGSVLQKAPKGGRLWKTLKKYSHHTSFVAGLIFIIMGYLIFSGKLIIFNQYVGNLPWQQWIYGVEEWLMPF